MCLIAVAWRASAHYPLIVAANRDEAHARPTLAAHWWPESPRVLAGRDQSAGGTWFGVDVDARFAAVTNLVVAGVPRGPGRLSRGKLVADFLRGRESAFEFAERVAASADDYGPFNLLLLDSGALCFVSSGSPPRALEPGVHAVSNVEPGVDWPKVATARRRVLELVEAGPSATALFQLLAERDGPVDGFDDRQISPFQLDPVWGTRSSTVVLADIDRQVRFTERSFDPSGARTGEVTFDFRAPAD